MMFAWPLLNEPLIWNDGGVQTLIIENKPMLRMFLETLRQQAEGMGGELVVSEDNRILEFARTVELLTDPFMLPLSSKKITSRLLQAAEKAWEPYGDELARLTIRINELAAKISTSMEYNVTYKELDGFEELYKLMGFRADEENGMLPERVLDYLLLARGLLGKKLFICYGLHNCLTDQEMALLCKEVIYRKLCLLLVEAVQPNPSGYEKFTVIDQDLCVI
jgi:CRISPR type II-A-associated protein Csn2